MGQLEDEDWTMYPRCQWQVKYAFKDTPQGLIDPNAVYYAQVGARAVLVDDNGTAHPALSVCLSVCHRVLVLIMLLFVLVRVCVCLCVDRVEGV